MVAEYDRRIEAEKRPLRGDPERERRRAADAIARLDTTRDRYLDQSRPKG